MPVYLPITEISVNALEIILLGVAVGFFSGLFGVGGGFLSMPFLMFVGIPPSIAAATQSAQIVASSAAGVFSQWRRRAIDVVMAMHMLGGGIGGLAVGAILFNLLKSFGQIDFAIAATYTLLLFAIGFFMLIELIKSFIFGRRAAAPLPQNRIYTWLQSLPRQHNYEASGVSTSIYGPIGIGFLGGVMVTLLGSGGSFMVVPAMIYFIGLPVLMVSGTSLFQLFFLATCSCIVHSLSTQDIDLMLAALLIAGSVIGTILGLRASRYIKGANARALLAFVILAVGLRMGWDLLRTPDDIFTLSME